MIDRIAKEVKEKTGGRIDIQGFPNGQLGSGKDMIEAVASGALTMTTDGAAALGAFLPQLSIIEAPYLWRDAAHMAKVAATPLFDEMNKPTSSRSAACAMVGVTYYGKRHLTTGTQGGEDAPPTWRASSCACRRSTPSRRWRRPGARGRRRVNFNELYLALSQGAVDGQENPLPTIAERQAQRGAEVPRAHRPHHHAAPRDRERARSGRSSRPPTAASSRRRSRTAPPGRTRSSPRRKRASSTPSRTPA